MQKEKFVNTMLFRHLILANNNKELVKMLDKSENPFALFLELLEDTYELDEDFFTLDKSITSKVLDVINNYRFDNKYRKKYSEKMNDYIVKMNRKDIINYEEKNKIYNSYFKKQEKLRHLNINNKYELLYLLRNDMVVYQTLLDGNMNQQTLFLIEEASTYFMKSCVELYDDVSFLENSYLVLNAETNNSKTKSNASRKSLIKKMNNRKK